MILNGEVGVCGDSHQTFYYMHRVYTSEKLPFKTKVKPSAFLHCFSSVNLYDQIM